jgi:hypothetical protein
MRVPNVTRAAINLVGVRLRRAERHWRTAGRMLDKAGRLARRQQERAAQAPELVRRRVQQGLGSIERSRKRLLRFDEHVLGPYRVERAVTRALARAAAGSGPILVGPWTSEVGYEVLYWVPFLTWAADRYGVSPDRLVVLSRGGTRAWYAGVASRYVEIFDLVEPREFAAQGAARRARGDQKQLQVSDFDHALIRMAKARLGITHAEVWHPGLMYQLFRSFWYGDRSLEFLLRHAVVRRMPGMDAPALPLPPEYVAMKFYTGPAVPDTSRNRDALRTMVQHTAAGVPVVMLDTAWSVDEHRDYAFEDIPGVTTVRPSLDPATNLGVQAQVIAGARRFVGTCGGLAWLAPLMGIETVAVYEDDRYLTAHLYAAKHLYRRSGAAQFSTLNLKGLRGGAPA